MKERSRGRPLEGGEQLLGRDGDQERHGLLVHSLKVSGLDGQVRLRIRPSGFVQPDAARAGEIKAFNLHFRAQVVRCPLAEAEDPLLALIRGFNPPACPTWASVG